jgi:vesicle transport protein SEC22
LEYASSYSIEENVIFLALCTSSFPRTLAFSYLEDLSRDFLRLHSREVDAALRPYSFIQYDLEMEKKRRRFCDMKQQHQLDTLHEELRDVKDILTKNLEDVIGRGEKIDGSVLFFVAVCDFFSSIISRPANVN